MKIIEHRILRGPIGRRIDRSAIPFRRQREPPVDIRHVHKKAGAAGGANVRRQKRRFCAALELMPWSRAFEDPIPLPRGRQLNVSLVICPTLKRLKQIQRPSFS
jgi:hypothetical protein